MAKKPVFNIKSEEVEPEATTTSSTAESKNFSRNMVGSYMDAEGSWHVVQVKVDPTSGETCDFKDLNVGFHISELEERLNIKMSQLGFFEEDFVNE